MALDNIRKLEKLQIHVFGNRRRAGAPQDSFVAMFNPSSFSMKHSNNFRSLQGVNTSGRQAKYSYGRSEELSLELVIDGSGVTQRPPAAPKPAKKGAVAKRIDEFLKQCFYLDGEIHEPKFLRIQWGTGPLRDFNCRLDSVEINYTSFDESGDPLRAVLNTVFVEDLDPGKRVRKERKSSPDLSHRRSVRAGDTLPGMCKTIYGSSSHYLTVARHNSLDDFRNLTPGMEIVFPPLQSDS